jgi:hypothetical protein
MVVLSAWLLFDFASGLPRYFPIDDAYIILRYARNVVEQGAVFAYNAGEPMAFFAFCGMEPILYIPLAFGAFLCFAGGRYLGAGCLAGLAGLCRPEAMFILFVMGAALLIRLAAQWVAKDRRGAKETLLHGSALGAGFLLCLSLWSFRCYQVAGTFLPSTVAIKHFPFNLAAAVSCWKAGLHMVIPQQYDIAMVRSALGGESALLVLLRTVPLLPFAALSLCFLRKRAGTAMIPFLYIPVHLVMAGYMNPSTAENLRYYPLDFALPCFIWPSWQVN